MKQHKYENGGLHRMARNVGASLDRLLADGEHGRYSTVVPRGSDGRRSHVFNLNGR